MPDYEVVGTVIVPRGIFAIKLRRDILKSSYCRAAD